MTSAKLVKVTFDYGVNKSINTLVQNNYTYLLKLDKFKDVAANEVYDEAVREAFQILRHWFHYKVPKWLSVINELQKYICNRKGLSPGNYTYYATLLENDFVRNNLSILIEYGVPRSAIEKLAPSIDENLNEDLVIESIFKNDLLNKCSLSEYEREKINDNV